MKKASLPVTMVLVLLMLASCAPGINELTNVPSRTGIVAGFWRGLWNGAISPATFIISLFQSGVQMYDVHNNGIWYNLGFFLGIITLFGGGARSARRITRRRN
jgi:ABC-type multidrug transport system permease subunit